MEIFFLLLNTRVNLPCGQSVAFLLCYDVPDQAQIQAEDHFLYHTLRERFKDCKIQLEFVSVREVVGRVNELIADKVNVFVDKFTFECRKFDPKIRQEIDSSATMLNLPTVRVFYGTNEKSSLPLPHPIFSSRTCPYIYGLLEKMLTRSAPWSFHHSG